MSATISPVFTAEDRLAELPADLVKRLLMAQGLFPEDRAFVPPLPAEPRPGGRVMAGLPRIRIPVIPDLGKLYALVVLAEKHVGAFRADMEKLMGQGAEDEHGGV